MKVVEREPVAGMPGYFRDVVVRRQGVEETMRSSGENWTDEEDEKLRKLYLNLCKKMTGRSPAAVFARIHGLRERHYYQWPETPE